MAFIGVLAMMSGSLLFNLAAALQAYEARKASPKLALRLGLLATLARQPRWTAGLLLIVSGNVLQIAAYRIAPFVVVQPARAIGLVVLLMAGKHLLKEAIGKSEVTGVAAMIAGVTLLALNGSEVSDTPRTIAAAIAVVSFLACVALAPFAVGETTLGRPMGLIVAAGVGFASTNIATKLMSDASINHLVAAGVWAGVSLTLGIAATILAMTAFQRCAASTVVPVSVAIQIFLPVIVEPIFLRERFGSDSIGRGAIIGGLLLAFIGCVLVSRSKAASSVLERA